MSSSTFNPAQTSGESKDDDFISYSTTTLYDHLGVGRDATEQQIKDAYGAYEQRLERARYTANRLAEFLSAHKGRSLNYGDDKMLACLQENELSASLAVRNSEAAYAVLSIPEKRKAYDEEIQREKQKYITNIFHGNLRRILSVDSQKAFFEEDTSIPVPPEFFYVRISPQSIGLALDYTFPNEDPLHTALYMKSNNEFFEKLSTRVNTLFINELFGRGITPLATRDGLFVTEEQAAKWKNRIVVKVKYKDPWQLKKDPIQTTDIVCIRASNLKCKVFENPLYQPADVKLKNQ